MTTAVGPLWPAYAAHEADAGRLQEAHSQAGSGTGARPSRVSRLHPCRGTNTSGGVGHQTPNRQATAPADPAGVGAMVSPQSSCASALPVSEAVREVARALAVL